MSNSTCSLKNMQPRSRQVAPSKKTNILDSATIVPLLQHLKPSWRRCWTYSNAHSRLWSGCSDFYSSFSFRRTQFIWALRFVLYSHATSATFIIGLNLRCSNTYQAASRQRYKQSRCQSAWPGTWLCRMSCRGRLKLAGPKEIVFCKI